jgi:hypothetical protein
MKAIPGKLLIGGDLPYAACNFQTGIFGPPRRKNTGRYFLSV